MSLADKFSSLSIGDEATILETIKKEGVEKSGFADNISVLVAKCDSKDDDESLAALATTYELAKACPEAEAFTKECLTACKFTFRLVVSFVVNRDSRMEPRHSSLHGGACLVLSAVGKQSSLVQ